MLGSKPETGTGILAGTLYLNVFSYTMYVYSLLPLKIFSFIQVLSWFIMC